jgi:U3 small nucleolar RNA-associated protein 3
VTIREEPTRTAVVAPETSDPATLIRHLEAYEPVKVALARDLPLVIRKIEKTARGIKAMMEEEDGHETLHKGLGWLHYRMSSIP